MVSLHQCFQNFFITCTPLDFQKSHTPPIDLKKVVGFLSVYLKNSNTK